MAPATDLFDLAALKLSTGEGRRLDLAVHAEPVVLGGETYSFGDDPVPVRLSMSRMAGGGYALGLELETTVHGPCMRCLAEAPPPCR